MSRVKKTIAVIFAVIAVMLMQTSVFAKTGRGTKNDPYIVTDYLEIVACVKENCYIKLGSDIKYNGNPLYVNGTDVHIDLNGSTLEDLTVTRAGFRSNETIIIMGNGKLTIDDSSGGDGKLISNKNNTLIEVGYTDSENKDNKLTVNGGSIINNNTGRQSDTDQYVSHAIFVYNGAVEVNDGLIYSKNSNALYVAGKTAVINGGTFKSDASDKYGIDVYYNQNVEINGGDIYGLNFLFTVASQLNNLKIKVNECNIYKKFRTGQGSLADFILPDASATIDGQPVDTSLGTFILTSPLVIKAPQYMVSFNANGGKGHMDSMIVKGGKNYTLPQNDFTPPDEDREFVAWLVDGKIYNEGDIINITSDTEVKAKWDRKRIVQFYDGWSGEEFYVYAGSGKQLTMPECTFTPKTGYQFAYWEYNRDSSVTYKPGEKATINEDMTFLACWETKRCKVYFNTNGIGTDPDTQTVLYNNYASRPTVSPVDGYAVSGWYTDKNCENIFSFETAITDDMTLYAKWEEIGTDASISNGETKTVLVYYGDDIDVYPDPTEMAEKYCRLFVNYENENGQYVKEQNVTGYTKERPLKFAADNEYYNIAVDPNKNNTVLTIYYAAPAKTLYGNINLVVCYKQGDLNENGKLDKEDAKMLLAHISGGTQLDDEQYERADVNDDGYMDVLDVIAILNKLN